MARRRFSTFQRRSSPNRAWTGAEDIANSVAGAGTKVLLGSFILSNSNIDETILRTVGLIFVHSDQVVATEGQSGAFGMIVVNSRALTAGAASIPGPIADIADDGWFVHVPFANEFTFVTGAGVDAQGATAQMWDFKSKRIVEDGFGIALMVESTPGSAGFVFDVIVRMLSMVKGTG